VSPLRGSRRLYKLPSGYVVRESFIVTVPPIRVCIIEDHPIVRAGLRMLIENQRDMVVVGETANRAEALAAARAAPPDIFLVDLDLGPENGLDLLPELLSTFKSARVLVLTCLTDTEAHEQAIAAGAVGVVLKQHAPSVLVKAIQRVHSGEVWLGRSLTTAVVTRLRSKTAPKRKDPDAEKITTLTPREREVIQLVAEGLNGQLIAKQLHISEATVKNHLTPILDKLGLANKFELAVYAHRHGLGKPSEDRLTSPSEDRPT